MGFNRLNPASRCEYSSNPICLLMRSFFLVLAASLALHSQAATTRWKGASEIVFAGTSTLHSWSGKVKAEPFAATVVTNDSGQPTHLEAKVQVKVAAFTVVANQNKLLYSVCLKDRVWQDKAT